MFWTISQYLFIAVVFIVAIVYIIKMIKDAMGSKKSCAKGCGCEDPAATKNSPEKRK